AQIGYFAVVGAQVVAQQQSGAELAEVLVQVEDDIAVDSSEVIGSIVYAARYVGAARRGISKFTYRGAGVGVAAVKAQPVDGTDPGSNLVVELNVSGQGLLLVYRALVVGVEVWVR